jgi:2-polyprenyl-6-methoxyphenol hydroxylase-like FAD-dependent oxidoreductase
MSDILIAGAGPTGMAAALFLAERGVSARIIEKRAEISHLSKALAVNPRTLALLEDTGVTERLLAQGRRLTGANLYRRGRRLFRVDLTRVENRYPFMLIHAQSRSEALLADALAERGVTVEREVELVDLTLNSDGANAVLRHGDGRTETATASTVLGADGSRSAVRVKLGVGFPGSSYEEPWQLYDLALEMPLPEDEVHVFFLDEGVLFLARIEGDVWRVATNVPDPLSRLPPGTRTGEIVWESSFHVSHHLAQRLQVGAACLAGDAAHLHSPLGGRGMNLGIEDAYVFAALAAEHRLADYDRLRRPTDAAVVRGIRRLTDIPRGRSPLARFVRAVSPAAPLLAPLFAPRMRRWLMGLDHEVRPR